MTATIRLKHITDPDGAAVDIFPRPTVALVGTYELLRYSGAISGDRRRGSSAAFPV
jgi:hypothetical protein